MEDKREAIYFNGNSSGGTAYLLLVGNSALDISGHNLPGVSLGTLTGDGQIFLGANNLTAGETRLFRIRSPAPSAMVAAAGGTGGSLTKVGHRPADPERCEQLPRRDDCCLGYIDCKQYRRERDRLGSRAGATFQRPKRIRSHVRSGDGLRDGAIVWVSSNLARPILWASLPRGAALTFRRRRLLLHPRSRYSDFRYGHGQESQDCQRDLCLEPPSVLFRSRWAQSLPSSITPRRRPSRARLPLCRKDLLSNSLIHLTTYS